MPFQRVFDQKSNNFDLSLPTFSFTKVMHFKMDCERTDYRIIFLEFIPIRIPNWDVTDFLRSKLWKHYLLISIETSCKE